METTAINLLSERVKNLSESATIAMARKSRELKAQGIDVISLSLGEPDFNTPDFIKQAAKEGIDQNYSKYMAVNGYEDLRMAISAKFKRDNNINYSKDQIVVSTGAKQSIANVVLSLINPGDEVIIPAPYWVSYADLVTFNGGKVISPKAGVEKGFKISAVELEKSLTNKTRLMIFSSPNNPSGAMYSENELKDLVSVLKKYPQVWIISDEIYEYIQYGKNHVSLASLPGMKDRVATVNGLSKGFAMTGWRIGFMGAPEKLARACEKIQSQFTSGASSIGQRAAISAVLAGPQRVEYMVKDFTIRRKILGDILKGAKHLNFMEPDGAFYLFVDASKYLNAKYTNALDLCMAILEGGVASVPGEAFGLDGYIRFSFATSEEKLKEAGARIVKTLVSIKPN